MSLAQRINDGLQDLPESAQAEVLDFVSFLSQKRKADEAVENNAWSAFSVAQAMDGLENEPDLYSVSDIKD